MSNPLSRFFPVLIASLLLAGRPALPPVLAAEEPDQYDAFNDLAKENFGPHTDELYHQFLGGTLTFMAEGDWIHASLNSAVIGFETNLPANAFIEYGPTAQYGQRTAPQERPFFLHVLYLRDLEPGQTYHYRLVASDGRGQPITSEDRTFTTRTADGIIPIPGTLAGPPYVLDQANATYVLTQDLQTPDAGIAVVADGITLDLNGHRLTFATEGNTPARQNNGIIVGRDHTADVPPPVRNVKLLNGIVIRPSTPAMEQHKSGFGFNNLFLALADAEVAGITVDFNDRSPQAWGGVIWNPEGKIDLHHNVFLDRGGRIANRHGAGVRPLGISNRNEPDTNEIRYHHNLIKRTRQNGFNGARVLEHNEVYVDSFSTNSFALQPVRSGSRVIGNRVFGTGFNPYGLGWAHYDMKATKNFIHMHGFDAQSRWHERWGDISMCEGFRVTNYGKGGQDRADLEYFENAILIRGGGGSELRGTGFFSDETIRNLVFHDNIVKVESLDEQTINATAISAHGHYAKSETSLPVYYRNNTLISNICHIRWADKYGKGQNHHVVNTKLVRTGNHPEYHTFAVEGTYWAMNNVVLDCEFGPGTAYNDVVWTTTSPKSFYDVAWTLTLKGPAGAEVNITDARGEQAFVGTIGDDGELRIPLTQARISPPKGYKKSERTPGCTETPFTPHTVAVKHGGKTTTTKVEMTAQRTLTLQNGSLAQGR